MTKILRSRALTTKTKTTTFGLETKTLIVKDCEHSDKVGLVEYSGIHSLT